MSRREGQAPDAKRGFSLLEVLVVLALITFLMAAIVVIMPRVANISKIAATRATIKKADEVLNDRLNGFRRYLTTQDTLAGNALPSYVGQDSLNLAGGNVGVAKIVAIKKLQQANFAQCYAELPLPVWQGQTQYSVGALIHYTNSSGTIYTFRCSAAPSNTAGKSGNSQPTWPTSAGQTVTDNNLTWQLIPINPVTQSAACLYWIMTQAAVFDTEPPSAADMKGVEVADTDGDGLLEVVDAWGHPVRYYRWPTRLIRPATSAGTVATAGWNGISPAPAPTPATILIRSVPRAPLARWAANFSYSPPVSVQPVTVPQGPPGDVMIYQYTGTAVQTSGGSEPHWANAMGQGQTITDGAVVWTAATDPLAVDSDDPNGLASSNIINESATQPGAATPSFHTWGTYHVTLIVSQGGDETLGLYEPYDTANFGNLAQPQMDASGNFLFDALYDNITNHQQ